MKETQKRIAAYKKALPHMKERVMAVAMMLIISVTMIISASFAWVTLSSNPEVSGLATTITANGNLEIALSDKDGLAPDETAVGDGNGNITLTNLKWGNLVNLSHESYGLEHLTLRPASLNTAALSVSPMTAVEYAEDGRVKGYLTNFSFSNFNAGAGVFDVHEITQYGVRAISSVTYSNAHAQSFYSKQLEKITASHADAQTLFSNVYGNKSYMNTVTALVGIHVSASMGDEDISCLSYMTSLTKMLNALAKCSDAAGQAVVDTINLYLYAELAANKNAGAYDSLAYELKDLKANNYDNELVTKYGGTVKGLTTYVTMAKKIDSALKGIEEAQKNEDGDVLWKRDLQSVANYLCDMDKAKLNGYTAAQLSSSYSTAFKILMADETPMAVIHEGALKDMDQLLGEPKMYVENLTVTITLPSDFGYGMGGRPISVTVNVTTGATEPYGLPTAYYDAYIFAEDATNEDRGTPVAADTYAMAVDFWVRTNEEKALLMLEGDIKYRVEYTPITGVNANGTTVPLYTYKNADGEEISVYKEITTVEGTETVTWYTADTHTVVDVGTATPTAQQEEKKTPIGYEGANRVWEELDDPDGEYADFLQNGTSTTQGSGSCYIFYPKTPEDEVQSKHLLQSMTVAFVSEDGALLGQASMDTDNAIEDAGRVIVPLKMQRQTKPIVVGKDANGDDITETAYITPLNQNEATRITAIIYLDGKTLTNSDVLAASAINGQLNIQFGLNKMEMAPVKDEDLMKETYAIQARIRDNSTGEEKWTTYKKFAGYDEETCKVDIKVTLAGMTATTVKGSFVSYISASQGARQPEFTMTYDEQERVWLATVPFTSSGDFTLRSLQIDGVDVALNEGSILEVEIPGISIRGLTCTNWAGKNSHYIMTADSSYSQELILTLGSQENHKIQGVFIGDNGMNITVDFHLTSPGIYTGTANFTTGGTYTMSYLLVDGVYTTLERESEATSLTKILTLKLGLQTTVILGQPLDLEYYELVEEMEAALEAASASEKDAVRADYEARIDEHLDLLYNGNGIEGDVNKNGLSLVRDKDGNLGFITPINQDETVKPLFIDVRCIVTDDQGNTLNGLQDVWLTYSAGSMALDAKLQENTSAHYYAGRFVLTESGSFSFSNLAFVQQSRPYTITAATSAPSITAIPPYTAEYVEQGAYEPFVFALGEGMDARALNITLKNAKAATVVATLTNDAGVTHVAEAQAAETDSETKVSTFRVLAPNDGYWEVTELKVKNVFYDGAFRAGTDEPDSWWVLNENVQEDEIGTTFITQAYFVVDGDTPQISYDKPFMTDNIASQTKPMTVSILGHDRKTPFEKVLKDYGLNVEVSVDLTYTLDMTEVNKLNPTGGTLPQSTFGVAETDENGNITMEVMNFLLPGDYYPTWSIHIAGDYTASYDYYVGTPEPQPSIFTYENTRSILNPVTVSWKAPDLTVTALDNTGINEGYTVNIGSDAVGGYKAFGEKVRNYFEPYYANMYVKTESSGSHVYPSMTMSLADYGPSQKADKISGKVVLPSAVGFPVEYDFADANAWAATKTVGQNKSGGGWAPDRGVVGWQNISTVAMTYDGVTYTLGLRKPVEIRQSLKPLYLQYTVQTTDQIDAPKIWVSLTGKDELVQLAVPDEWEDVSSSNQDTTISGYTDLGTKTVSEFIDGGCNGDDGYQNYTRSTRTYDVNRVTTTVTTQKKIAQWTIDGTNYTPGSYFAVKAVSVKKSNGDTEHKAYQATDVAGNISSTTTTTEAVYTITECSDKKVGSVVANPGGDVVEVFYTNGWEKDSEKKKS